MNPLFEQLMRRATDLTQDGRLEQATQAIQQALGAAGLMTPPAGRPADFAGMSDPFDAPHAAPHVAKDDRLVVDVEARVIEGAGPVTEAEVPRSQPAGAHDRWTRGLFAHQQREIAYKLFVPAKGSGEARGLILMLHGCTQDPDDFAAGTRMNELAREQGFLVLYPAQTQHANSSKCWNWFKTQHQQRGRGEPALLAALTQSVIAAEGVDPDRVYVAGLSAGGAMADILGRCYPDVFAAVGVHSGLPAGAASDLVSGLAAMKNGAAARPPLAAGPGARSVIPTIVFHGDADPTVHLRNGDALVANALAGQAEAQAQSFSGRASGGRAFTRRTHLDARGRPMVEHWLLHGAGHAWSGGAAKGSYTDPTGPDASAEMLRFFATHRRQGEGSTH